MIRQPSLSLSATSLSYSTTTSPTTTIMSEAEDDATVLMDEEISSPPRSNSKPRANLLFPSGDCDSSSSVFSHAPSSPSDEQRKITLSPNNIMKPKTPKSRRLFDDEPAVQRGNEQGEEESLHDLLQDFSPPHPGYGHGRRYTLKPLDLNHHELATTASTATATAAAASSAETQVATAARRELPPFHESTTRTQAAQRRKRASPARRRLDHAADPKTPYRSNALFPPTEGAAMMHTSPHMSPNSFLTMDGRFVQSKNPFSSPMMTDEDNLTPRPQPPRGVMSRSPAPSFPVSFPTDAEDDGGRHHARLPPRAHGPAATLSAQPPLRGFPDHRFSFTGSPISEVHPSTHNYHRTAEQHYNHSCGGSNNSSSSSNNNSAVAMDTDTASTGSLHKVRRLSREDDVVAATGQHLRNAVNHPLQRPPNVDTNANFYNHKNPWDSNDDISPTEVANFPPTRTPAKSRREPSPPPYARIGRRGEPSTPVRPSRSHHHHAPAMPSTANDDNSGNNKSRFHQDFDIIGELGKGSFGQVYKVLSRLDGCMYAIKAGHRPAKGRADRDRMLKEVYALAALSDQADTATFHIVRYHQAWMEEDRLYIQTELCTGTLSDEIARSGRLTEPRRYKIMREMLLALGYIHGNHMVHLDIKPDNIFLKNDQYKLGDFGLVTQSSSAQDVEEGDSRYMSLELLQGDRSDLTKSDIFSLGITLYEICRFGGVQGLPMNGDEWQDLRAGRFQLPLPDTGPEMTILIQRMMNPNPDLRPAASDLLKHPQLLSEEQKALNKERSKVAQANMQLAAHQFGRPPSRKRLVRANTWNGNLSIL